MELLSSGDSVITLPVFMLQVLRSAYVGSSPDIAATQKTNRVTQAWKLGLGEQTQKHQKKSSHGLNWDEASASERAKGQKGS